MIGLPPFLQRATVAPARYGAGGRQRGGALALAVLLHLLVFAILLMQRAIPVPVKMSPRLKAFMLMPEAKEQGDKSKEKTKAKKSNKNKSQKKPPPPPPPKQPPPSVPSDNKLPFILMSSDAFAATDISHKQSHKVAAANDTPTGDAQGVYGPSEGPGGATLYNADWYREPTNVELSGYLPSDAPRTGWGMIACKTIAHYHVDDCITLGESPRGSGFARAVQRAAWQFLILPPRINGRPMIGSWVRIRITYTDGGTVGPG